MGETHKYVQHLQVLYANGNHASCWGWQNEEVFLLPPGNPCEVGVSIATSPSKLMLHRCSDAGGDRVSYVTLASFFSSETGSTQKAAPDRCLKHSREKILLDSCKVIYVRQECNSRKPWSRETQWAYEHHCSHSTNSLALSAAKYMIWWKHFNRY